MQKVYLLLRNNQQTGPYTFEELLQLHLKPHDLIWVEGKSYGWRYPAEVETLKPYMTADHVPQKETEQIHSKTVDTPSVTTAHPKKVFVSMPINVQPRIKENAAPFDPIEEKAEELRKKAQAYTPSHPEETKTNYNRNLNEAEEDYTKWMYKRKKKKSGVPKKTVAVAGVGVLILLAGWWVKDQFISDSSVTKTINATQQNNLPKAEGSTTNNALVTEEENTTEKKTKPNPKIEKIKKEKPEVSAEKAIVQKETPASETVSSKNEQIVEQITENDDDERKNDSAVDFPEKKKTLKEKLGDLFKKKKENLPEEEPKVADNANSERRATRREDASGSVTVTDVSELVDLKTNKIADSWMMGVKNVKLTLYNRSNLTINAAQVEVSYYSDQNNLLERKTISYSNIAPQKSQTATIPDNRLADHIDYKVLSATGVENAYATR